MQSQFYYTKFPITIIPEITIDVKYKLTGHMNSLVRTKVILWWGLLLDPTNVLTRYIRFQIISEKKHLLSPPQTGVYQNNSTSCINIASQTRSEWETRKSLFAQVVGECAKLKLQIKGK